MSFVLKAVAYLMAIISPFLVLTGCAVMWVLLLVRGGNADEQTKLRRKSLRGTLRNLSIFSVIMIVLNVIIGMMV